jgi:hypothetical protein
MSAELETLQVKLEVDDGDLVKLGYDVAEVRAEFRDFAAKKYKATVDADTSKAKRNIDELRASMAALEAENKRVTSSGDALSNQQKGWITRRNQEIAGIRSEILAEQDRLRAGQRVSTGMAAAIKQETIAKQELTAATKTKVTQDKADAAQTALNETADLRRAESLSRLAKLQTQYAAAAKRSNDLQKAYSRAQGSDKQRVKLDSTSALADMEVLREKLKLMGEDPIDQKVKVKSDSVQKLSNIFFGRQDISAAERATTVIGDLKKALSANVNIGPISAPLSSLLVAASALAPLVTGLVGALGSLISVAGAGLAGALGVGGAALTGFGLAGVGIFAMLKPLVSQFTNLRTASKAVTTAIQQYGAKSTEAKNAQHALNAQLAAASPAVRAATKDWIAASGAWHKLTDKAAVQDFGSILHSTMQTARSDVGFYARDSVTALKNVSAGWSNWMKDLRSPAVKTDLNNIFSKFDTSIPNVLAGFQNLGNAMLKVFSTFANFMPGLSKGFDDWTKGIDGATNNSTKLESAARRVVTAMQDVGHFTSAAGKFLVAFFNGGVKPGEGFLDDMTKGLKRVTDQMETLSGQTRLQDFFQRSVATTENLFGALVPLIRAFTNLGTALRPVTDIALALVSALSAVIAKVIEFKPLRDAAGFLLFAVIAGRLLSTIYSLGKGFGGLVLNVGKFAAGMKSLGVIGSFKNVFGGPSTGVAIGESAAETMLAAAPEIGAAIGTAAAVPEAAGGAAGGAAAAVPEVAGGVAGAELAPATAPVAEEAGADTIAAAGLEVGLGTLAGAAVIAVAGFAGLTAVLGLFGSGGLSPTEKLQNALNSEMERGATILPRINKLFAQNDQSAHNAAKSGSEMVNVQKQMNDAEAKLNKLQADGLKGTKDYRSELEKVLNDYTTDVKLQGQRETATSAQIANDQKAVSLYKGDVSTAQKNQVTALGLLQKAQSKWNGVVADGAQDTRDGESALSGLRTAQANYTKATNEAAVASGRAAIAEWGLITQHINLGRESKNLAPIIASTMGQFGSVTEHAGTAVGALVSRLKMAGQIKAVNFLVNLPNPNSIVQITKMIDNLKSMGDVKTAFDILGNAKSAQDAINAINRLQVNEKKLVITNNIADSLTALSKVNGVHVTQKELKLIHSGDIQTIAALAKVNGIPMPAKLLKLLGDNSAALTAHQQVDALSDISKSLTINSNVGSVISAVGALAFAVGGIPSSKTVSISEQEHIIKTHATGGLMTAAGGISNDPVLRDKQRRAAITAISRPVSRTQTGGLFTKPTYLVGEENRPEFVIATNPAYRKQNEIYLAHAAREFGMNLTAAASGTMSADAKHKKHHAAHGPVIGLPAQDRIGGVGTADIDAAVQAAQTALDSKVQALRGATQSVQVPYKSGKGSYSKSEPKYSADTIGKMTQPLRTKLDNLKKFDNSAKNYIQKFTNLETEIGSIQNYLTTANASPDDHATGYNAQNQKVRLSWDQWLTQLQGLDAQHTTLLHTATTDAKKYIGKDSSASMIGYVKTLEAALGQSIVDQGAANADIQGSGAGDPQSAADYITSLGLDQTLAKDQYLLSLATANTAVDDPGTAANEALPGLEAQQVAALTLQNFYASILSSAQRKYPNQFGLLNDIAGDYGSAESTYQAAAAAVTGVTTGAGAVSATQQQQLASSSLYSMFQDYGSNAANVMQAAATGFDPTAASGSAAAQALSPAARLASAAPISHQTDNSKTANVVNNYTTAPDDPHSWSKSLNWELEHAL